MAVKQRFPLVIYHLTFLQWITNQLHPHTSAFLVCLEYGPLHQASASLTTSGDLSC